MPALLKITRHPGYAWVIVVVAALAMVATLPGRTHGLGMITERLLADPHAAPTAQDRLPVG